MPFMSNMLVFKFCYKSTKEKTNEKPRNNKDFDFTIASNGLWNYIEEIENNHSIVKCTFKKKE